MCLSIHNMVLKKDPKNKYIEYVNKTAFHFIAWTEIQKVWRDTSVLSLNELKKFTAKIFWNFNLALLADVFHSESSHKSLRIRMNMPDRPKIWLIWCPASDHHQLRTLNEQRKGEESVGCFWRAPVASGSLGLSQWGPFLVFNSVN